MKCTATCLFGLESVLASELKKMNYEDIESSNGRVSFSANLEEIAKANINLRTAERVYIELASFYADNFDVFFDKLSKIQFHRFIEKDARFPVSVSSISSKLSSVPTCQSVAKKAIVNAMSVFHKTQRFSETGTLYPINIFILKDIVKVYLDTSGSSLYKRGYRSQSGLAPLKETLASAMVQLSYWRKGMPLVDPFCGSGTLVIEAAMIAKNIAPGLYRSFVSEDWKVFNKGQYSKVREYFKSVIDNDYDVVLNGYDIDKQSIKSARENAKNANVENITNFQVKDFNDMKLEEPRGIIICNPPYGERLEDVKSAQQIYSQMGVKFKDFPGWSKYILAPEKIFEQEYGNTADKRRKLYNGKILCYLYQYFGKRGVK